MSLAVPAALVVDDARPPGFSARERRILLWLVVAAICWRWFLTVQTPLPAPSACEDLWLAARLAAGDLGAAAPAWLHPWWAFAVLPAVALGVEPFAAAQVLACLLGGFALVPAAIAAERLRQGAGVPAAILAALAAAPAGAAAAADGGPLLALAAALACAAFARGTARGTLVGSAVAALVAAAAWSNAAPGPAAVGERAAGLVAAWSIAGPMALLALLPPRPRAARWLWVALAAAAGVAIALPLPPGALVAWQPLVAVLAGVGLRRLPARLCELLLAVFVALECRAAWMGGEPRAAFAERLVGAHLAGRLAADDALVADLPRVALFAGRRPFAQRTRDDVAAAARAPDAAFVVLGGPLARDASLTALLAAGFARYELPHAIGDEAAARAIAVFVRR